MDKSIWVDYHRDENGNPTTVKIDKDIKIVSPLHNTIYLQEIPDKNQGVVAVCDETKELPICDDLDELTINNCYIDYLTGKVYFHQDYSGKPVVFNYYGKGIELLGASRVYDEHGLDGKTIRETLQDMIDKGRKCIEVLLLFGDLAVMIKRIEKDIENATILSNTLRSEIDEAKPLQESLHQDIIDANVFKDSLKKDVAEGKALQPVLQKTVDDATAINTTLNTSLDKAKPSIDLINSAGNPHFDIKVADWIVNTDTNSIATYMFDIAHTLQTKYIQVNIDDTVNGLNILPDCRKVDNNTIRIFSSEKVDVTVTLSARYYDGGSAIADEVVIARGTFESLGKRLDKVDSQLDDIPNQTYIIDKATKSELEVERQRINSFTKLTEGSTTGDAELIDARIGADGTIYSTVGHSVRSQINDLKKDIISQTIIDFSDSTVGYYISNGGSKYAESTFSIKTINVFKNDKIILYAQGYLTNVSMISRLNKDETITPLIISKDGTLQKYIYTVIEDMTILLCYQNNKDHSCTVNSPVFYKKEDIDSINNDINKNILNYSAIENIEKNANVVKIEGSYISNTGNIYKDATSFYTEIFEIIKDEKIIVTSKDPSGSAVGRITKWSKDGVFEKCLSEGTTTETTFEYIATEGKEYLRFCGYIPNGMVIKISNYELTDKMIDALKTSEILKDTIYDIDYSSCISRILCVGDSLTAGDSYFEQGKSAGDNAKAYPYFLSKKMNIECINAGHSGADAKSWMQNDYSKFDYSKFDCMILWLGTNNGMTDTLETDVNPFDNYLNYSNTNTGQYCRIIKEFKEKSNDGHIAICLLSWWDDEQDKTTNTVIQKIAQKYNCQLINTDELKASVSPLFHWEVNSLHFNTYGNMYIANKFHQELNNYWKNNINNMDFSFKTKGNGLPWWMTH